MVKRTKLATAIKLAALSATGAAMLASVPAFAQNEDVSMLEEVMVTGTRITIPGTVSSSPITSIGAEEFEIQQKPEIEEVLRNLPSTLPGDGSNVNNGSAGAATVNLRGLGSERTLVLTNGKRMVPFNYNGQVDVSTVPSALVERVDIVTGGASAVYGSDAIAGAVNIILKDDFEGVDLSFNGSETADGDGNNNSLSLTFGSNFASDKGNAVMNVTWSERDAIMLGDRDLGLLGIDTSSGANYEEFLAGQAPAPAPANCGGPYAVASGGSTTAIPTRWGIVGVGASGAQFGEDGTLTRHAPTADIDDGGCSLHNFNPFNFYQTPMERWSATAMAHLELNDHAEVYGSATLTNTTVDTQVAPSGTFGQSFWLPLNNPLIGAQARQYMLDAANANIGLLGSNNWIDTNGNGIVDAAGGDQTDYLNTVMRRRTLELGARSERFDSDMWQLVAGVRGDITDSWNYDVSFQYGESNRVTVRDGYTNLTNIANALDSYDGVTCNNGDPTCVPINLFGGFGTITEEMAGYARAVALQQQTYDQMIFNASATGTVDVLRSPFATNPLALSVGFERREETGAFRPDECLKLAPASCQGGAGGNALPIEGGYEVKELFIEGVLPLVEDVAFAQSLSLEMGYRASDYDVTGSDETWKIGANWRPVDSLLVRVMQQKANRAPNVGEIASPVTTGLDNAQLDPCSAANAGNIDAALEALCISTGMTAAQVGTVPNVISGQVNVFAGSDPANPPAPEDAETFTAGFVWEPEFDGVEGVLLSVDYYSIDVQDVIGEFSAQGILDLCYEGGNADACSKINRVSGDLTLSGSGIDLYTTNLDYMKVEGVEIGFAFGFNLGNMGDLQFAGNINQFLTHESQDSALTPVIDCNGYYGTSCDPTAELAWTQRTTWNWDKLAVSLQWRHTNALDVQKEEAAGVYEAFRTIDAYDYFDLYASYQVMDNFKVSLSIDNLLDEEPPVVGGEAGSTTYNSGNTFPSHYDVLGTVYTVGAKLTF